MYQLVQLLYEEAALVDIDVRLLSHHPATAASVQQSSRRLPEAVQGRYSLNSEHAQCLLAGL